jgi:hypothetical protein
MSSLRLAGQAAEQFVEERDSSSVRLIIGLVG